MKTKLKLQGVVFSIIAMLVSSPLLSQELNAQTVFLYYAALTKRTPDECIDRYASSFDTYNYNQANSDEFEKKRYREKIRSQLSYLLDKVNYTTKYTCGGTGTLGEYSFSEHLFPITSFNPRIKIDATSKITTPNGNDVRTTSYYANDPVINIKDFNVVLKMDETAASQLIASRKDSKGYINRSIYFKITYSIVNTPPYAEYRLATYIHSIEIYDSKNVLAVIYPSMDYFDKANGIKMKEGQEIIYYKNQFRESFSSAALTNSKSGETPSKTDASFYKVINYKNGKITDVKDYYISGKLQLEGQYTESCADPHCANGIFTWYYENGLKKQQANYVNGTMNGCFYAWENDGKCASWAELIYINKGTPSTNNRECKCTDQNNGSAEKKPGADYNTGISKQNSENTNTPNTNTSNKLSKLLLSPNNGNVAKNFLSGKGNLYTNKKTGTVEPSNIIIVFPNKTNELEFQPAMIQHILNYLDDLLKLTPEKAETFDPDSLFKIELLFAQRFQTSVVGGETFWNADIMTYIFISKNGTLLKKDTFMNSTPMFSGKRDKWVALEDAILKSEKKIGKVLDDYISIQ